MKNKKTQKQTTLRSLPQKQTTKPTHSVGTRVKMSEEQFSKVKLMEKDLLALENALGRARAIYVAAEQDYIQKRITSENERMSFVKEVAASLDVPTEGDQQWEFYQETGEFERKK